MNRTIIQGTTLDYDIKLVSMTLNEEGEQEVDNILPLSLNSINYLEIADTLPNVGLDGGASINNNFQILDQLGITKLADKTLHLTFDITDADLYAGTQDKELSSINFNALLETNSDLGSNIANKSSIFKFEESLSARLKKSSVVDLFPIKASSPGPRLIHDVLTFWANESNIDPQIFLDYENLFVEDKNSSIRLQDLMQIEGNIYDLIYKIHNSFTYGEEDALLPPLLRFKNVIEEDGSNLRKLTLEPIITDTGREFIKDYKEEKPGEYLDTYQEEFIITGDDDTSGNSSLHNQIEEYSLIKPDYNTLRRNFWGRYHFIESGSIDEDADPTFISENSTGHDDYIRYFNTGLLGDLDSNIPLIPLREQKVHQRLFGGSEPSDPKLVEASVINRVLKSFIYLNEAIVLNVKGQIYRKPGRFITIIDGNNAINDIKVRLTNLWYVTEVKHIIKQGLYTNKITAVRILGKTKTPSPDNNNSYTRQSEDSDVYREIPTGGPDVDGFINMSEVPEVIEVQDAVQPTRGSSNATRSFRTLSTSISSALPPDDSLFPIQSRPDQN